MRSHPRLLICLFLFFYITVLVSVVDCVLRDPYKILGVRRNAQMSDVKRAYKKLVRHWHPDRNNSPEAEDRFIEVSKAYELLSDPERRHEFHRFGTTEDTPNFRHKRDYSDFNRFDIDHLKPLFTSDSSTSFNFEFGYDKTYIFRKQTITTKAYQNKIMPNSIHQPQIILFYDDACMRCMEIEPMWMKIVHELEPLGVDFATIHSKHESSLAGSLITEVPYIVGVVDGAVRHYKDSNLSLLKMIEFIRRILPKHLVTIVDDSNYENFLSGWTDNRVRVLFINDDKVVKLRYILTAFYFRERAVCGHVNGRDAQSTQLIQRYNVDLNLDSMLIFNEDIDRPVASLAAADLVPQIVKDMLHSNKYLLLPRLTSQIMFDQICPVDRLRTRRRLCVLLVTNNIPQHEPQREAMRQFILENGYADDRFRFMYVFEAKQKDFIKSLTIKNNGSPENMVNRVVVLWRREHDRMQYEWLPSEWDVDDPVHLNQTKVELIQLLSKLSFSNQKFTYKAKTADLIDEHASSLFGRIVKKLLIITDNIGDNISKKDVLPFLSLIASIGFILLIGYIMHHLVKMEEQTIQEQYRRLGKVPPGTKPKIESKLSIHELRGETYNGLIRLLKPGCRTIVLLCNASSKIKLLRKFYSCVYPYRKNKTLMFAYLMVEKNVDWYKNLLLQTLGDYRDLNINPKNCIGTVLCLNGFKKYFCVYHAKYSEKSIATEDSLTYDDDESEDVEAGNLICRQSNSGSNRDVLFESDLLDGLPSWLERLFEGATHRYYIQYWPDNMK